MNTHTPETSDHRQPRACRRLVGFMRTVAVVLALNLPSPALAQGPGVDLRPSAPGEQSRRIGGIVETAGPGGIVVVAGEGPAFERIVISLDQVPTQTLGALNLPPALEQAAVELWRARVRIERCDFQAAEPVLERLAPAMVGAGGPTGALVAEGLLTCRLAREARSPALFAWLGWLRIVRSGPGLPDAPAGSLVAPPTVAATAWEGGRLQRLVGARPVDSASGLVPALPPIWIPGASTDALASSADWDSFNALPGETADAVSELAALYRAAALAESGQTVALPARVSAFEGTRLVRDIVAGRIGDETARAAARESMAARSGAPETARWIEAWCRAGVGRSLVVEPDPTTRRRGVLELLHLPARFSRDQHHLAGIALAEASLTLGSLGDADGAGKLLAELLAAFPGHLAHRWAMQQRAGGVRGLGPQHALSTMAFGSVLTVPAWAPPVAIPPLPPGTPEEAHDHATVVGPDDALEAYLVRLGLTTLLAEHLEVRLAALSRETRGPVAERLARLYVRLLEVATDASARSEWERKADALLREVPEAEGFELRISLSRALYVRAEDICERQRLRLVTGDEAAEAERVLRQLEPQFREIASKVHRRVDTLERIEKQGDATDELNRQLADARRVRSLAFYYSGWCNYYLAMVARSEPAAIDAVKAFGWLLNSPNGRIPTIDRVTSALLRYEHVARAALGCALAASVRGNDAEAMAWIEALEEAEELPEPVRRQLLLRKIGILGAAKRWADLERTIRLARNSDRSGAGPGVRPLETTDARLLAVVTLEADRRIAQPGIESLAKIALGDLIGRGEVGHVLDLVEKFGTAPIGESGFVVHYVRAMKAYDDARGAHKATDEDPEEPTRADNVLNLYRAASGLLTATLAQSDAEFFRPERVRAAMFAARAAFYAGDFEPAAEAFGRAWETAASINRASPEAEEALWLRVVALDRAASLPAPRADLVERRSEAGVLFLQTYPDSPRASRLLLMRAASGDVSDDEALRVLEGVARDAPMYLPARRQVARILYARFRAATGSERDFAAMKFIGIAEELLALDRRAATEVSGKDIASAERAIVRARQLLDALLGVSTPDADRAQSTLDLIRTLAAITGLAVDEHEAELLYRELQIAAARGQSETAAGLAHRLGEMPAAQREFGPAAERLLYRRAITLMRKAPSESEKFGPARDAVTFGARVLDRMASAPGASSASVAGVQSSVADAAFLLWRASGGSEAGGGDEAMRDLALRLDKAVLKTNATAAEPLRRVAMTAEASGEKQIALDAWGVLLSAAAAGSDAWFEARYHALRLVGVIEPVRARELLAQHRTLFPMYGPTPWGERIRELDVTLGAPAPAPPPSTPSPAVP